MKIKIILVLFSLLIIQSGCDRVYILKVNNQTQNEYSFDCGKSTLMVKTIMWKDFDLVQKYIVNNPIVLFPDSLKIYFNSDDTRIIRRKILINGKEPQSKEIAVKDSADIDIIFSIGGNMNYSDTLKIIYDAFTKCNNINVFRDTIKIPKNDDYVVKSHE